MVPTPCPLCMHDIRSCNSADCCERQAALHHVLCRCHERRPALPGRRLQITRDAATGQLKRTPSWHSFGSSLDSQEASDTEVMPWMGGMLCRGRAAEQLHLPRL